MTMVGKARAHTSNNCSHIQSKGTKIKVNLNRSKICQLWHVARYKAFGLIESLSEHNSHPMIPLSLSIIINNLKTFMSIVVLKVAITYKGKT